MKTFEVGDLVTTSPEYIELTGAGALYCGSGMYDYAVVVSVDPFVLVSQMGDMKWTCVPAKEVVGVGKAFKEDFDRAMARWGIDNKVPTKMKLFVWEGVLRDRSDGMAIAYAETLEDALGEFNGFIADSLGKPTTIIDCSKSTDIFVACVCGGG